MVHVQGRAVLAREALAKEGKLEATLQACAEDAARRNVSFFVLPQGTGVAFCLIRRYAAAASTKDFHTTGCNHSIACFMGLGFQSLLFTSVRGIGDTITH